MTALIRGAIAGSIGTWIMDLTTTGLQQNQSKESAAREKAAQPNGKSSIENLVDRMEGMTGRKLGAGQRSVLMQSIHYALGAVPGALYATLRNRVPFVGMGGGLVYGAALFVVNDEWLNSQLGLSGPVQAYPIGTHLRGLVGHLVLGSATDSVADLLGA
ncbi:MAG: DUF1440 domain-containing protein [Candidatus Limnocylindrales bacterium]